MELIGVLQSQWRKHCWASQQWYPEVIKEESVQHVRPVPFGKPLTFSAGLWRDGFLLAFVLLLSLGTLMVFSATGFSRSLELQTDFLHKHLVFLGLGSLLLLGIWQLPTRVIERAAPWLFLLGLALLLLVLIPGIGMKVNGARRWFRLGPVSLQPSEFMKILLPLFLAGWTAGRTRFHRFCSQLAGVLVLLAVPLLIAIQPDLGTALMVFGMGACYLFLSGWPLRIFVGSVLLVLPALGGLMLYRPYQLERVTAFLSALSSWEQAQYQVKQSLLSIGSGGLWGTGPGRGLQKMSFLPESHTDFIFAVVGEEFGLIGLLTVVGLWCLLLICGLRLIQQAELNRERQALAGTLLLGIVTQALVNTCVVTSLLPPKGISHPLLSYGGSNLLATMLAVAILLNLTCPPQPHRAVDRDTA